MPMRPSIACHDCDHGLCSKHGQIQSVVEPSTEKIPTPKTSYQHLYWRARWRNPKTGLEPACLRKHPICADPFKIGCHSPSTVADHIIDHEGDEKLFFEFSNLQGLCKQCHDRKTGKSHGKGGRNLPAATPVLIDGRINGASQV
jgi:5-methylcytosine-specific restriction protein A